MRDLVENIISEGCIPTDWQESFIVNLYKGKGDALNRGNYRGLKLIEQVMKVLERVVEGLIRQRVEIDEMQCGFMSGRGTTDAIFIVRQLQEKHLAANKPLYMAFVDLEKALDRVPGDVIWWAMRKLGIDEWLVRLVQSMYKDVRSRVRVGDGYSEEFGVGVGVHQGSVLSPLLQGWQNPGIYEYFPSRREIQGYPRNYFQVFPTLPLLQIHFPFLPKVFQG